VGFFDQQSKKLIILDYLKNLAGEGNVDTRIENYKTTINSIKLPNRLLTKRKLLANDGTDNFDCVFWFGDFNFRVDQEKSKVVNKILDVRKKRSINFEEIMNHDELYRMITEGFDIILSMQMTNLKFNLL